MKMSSKIPIATDEIFALSASLSQMGIPKEQLIEFTEMVSKAAFAFVCSLKRLEKHLEK